MQIRRGPLIGLLCALASAALSCLAGAVLIDLFGRALVAFIHSL